ncbi:MAG: hypothetical protein U9O78_05155 [Patescibacteria group bacterium]|nr:hypothetical protein [Patescibacteria group bacterium]
MNDWGELANQIIKFAFPFVKKAEKRRNEEAKRYKKIYSPLLILVRDVDFESSSKITFLQKIKYYFQCITEGHYRYRLELFNRKSTNDEHYYTSTSQKISLDQIEEIVDQNIEIADRHLIEKLDRAVRAKRYKKEQVSLERSINPKYYGNFVPEEFLDLVGHIYKYGKKLKKRYQFLVNIRQG